jgi:UDP-N-acetylmuramyl pentapeptide synthase
MRDEEAIADVKEAILFLARKLGTEEDGHDYVMSLAIAGAELVELEKQSACQDGVQSNDK